MHISTQRHSRGTKLRKLILSDELKPAHRKRELPTLSPAPDTGLSPSKRTHQRSKSDATASISLSSNLKRTASNPKVENEDEVKLGGGTDGQGVLGLHEDRMSYVGLLYFLSFPLFISLIEAWNVRMEKDLRIHVFQWPHFTQEKFRD